MKTLVKTGAIAFVVVAIGCGNVKGGEDIDKTLVTMYGENGFMNKMYKNFDYEGICAILATDLHLKQCELNEFWCSHKKDDPNTISDQIKKIPKLAYVLEWKKTYKAARKWAFGKIVKSFDLVLLYQLVRAMTNGFSELDGAHPLIKEKHKERSMVVFRWLFTLYPLYIAEIKIYEDLCQEMDKRDNLKLLKDNLKYRFEKNNIYEKVSITDFVRKPLYTDLSCKKLYDKNNHRPGALYNVKKDTLVSKILPNFIAKHLDPETYIKFMNPDKNILVKFSGKEMRMAVANIRKQIVNFYKEYMGIAPTWEKFWDAGTVILDKTFEIQTSLSCDNFEELEFNAIIDTFDNLEINDEKTQQWLFEYLETPIFSPKIEKNMKLNEIKNDIKKEKVEKTENIEKKEENKKDEITEQNNKKKELDEKKK